MTDSPKPYCLGGVAAVDKPRIVEGISRYTSPMGRLQDYLEENGAGVWSIKRWALLYVWLVWIAALLNLDGEYEDKLGMSRSGVQIMLAGRNCVSKPGPNDFKTITPDQLLWLSMILTIE